MLNKNSFRDYKYDKIETDSKEDLDNQYIWVSNLFKIN